MNNTPGKVSEVQTWIEVWRTCTQDVLAQVSSEPIAFEITPESLPLSNGDLHFLVTAGGAAHGEMCLRIPSASAICLGRKFLGQAEAATDTTAEHKEALEELLRQVAGVAASTISSNVGSEVQLHLAASSAPSWSPASAVCLGAREKTGEMIVLELQMSPALAQALPSKMASKSSSAIAELQAATASESSYERLRGVALDVSLRFGTRRMQLHDVLALSTGIVVELDNKVQSPADLLLDGRVIARGEVVVVDGKYGLRVTEIPAPSLRVGDSRHA